MDRLRFLPCLPRPVEGMAGLAAELGTDTGPAQAGSPNEEPLSTRVVQLAGGAAPSLANHSMIEPSRKVLPSVSPKKPLFSRMVPNMVGLPPSTAISPVGQSMPAPVTRTPGLITPSK